MNTKITLSALILLTQISISGFCDQREILDGWKGTWSNLVSMSVNGLPLEIEKSLVVSHLQNKFTYLGDDVTSVAQIRIGTPPRQYEVISYGVYGPTYIVFVRLDGGEDKSISLGKMACVPSPDFVYSADGFSAKDGFYFVKKYKIQAERANEVTQPFYVINLKTSTNRNIDIRSKEEGGEIIATLNKGSPVTIIGTSTSNQTNFLVLTQGGIVGWHALLMDQKTGKYSLEIFNLAEYKGI